MNIIALDIGTTTGWAANLGSTLFEYDSVELVTEAALRQARKDRMDRKLDPRVGAMLKLVDELICDYHPDLVVFEDVKFIKSSKQGHLWPSLRAAIWMSCLANEVPTDCLDVNALKAFATGQRSADKAQMLAALKKTDPDLKFGLMDDNVVDAIWLWKWATQTYKAHEKR